MKDKFKQIFPIFTICLFFFCSVIATVIAWLSVVKIMDNQVKETYFQDNQVIKNWIQTRINTYLDLLIATQGYVTYSDHVTRNEWNNFTKNIQITERYQGLRAIIYAPKVLYSEKAQFLARIKRENSDLPIYANFSIYPEATKEVYFPVTYIYGVDLEARLQALGLDVYSEPNRIAALDQSRDNNRLTFSAPIDLLVNPKPGFIITLPIFQQGSVIDTLKQRRESLKGFIYAPFQADEFFDAILKPQGTDAFPEVDMEVYDPQADVAHSQLYDKNTSLSLSKDTSQFAYTNEFLLNLGDRHWKIVTGVSYKSFASHKWATTPLVIFVSGLFLSVTTFTILLAQYHHIKKITQSN